MMLTLLALGATASAQDAAFLRINEAFPAPSGTDAGQEWVEVYNTAFHQVDLAPCVLERAKGSWEEVVVLAGMIEPGTAFLVADPDVETFADLRLPKGSSLDLGNAGSNADGVRLVCDGAIIDTLLYGSNNDDGLADDVNDPALEENLSVKATDGTSLARMYDGDDTDDSAVDFCKDDTPSPGEWNTCPAPEDTGGDTGWGTGVIATCADPIRINEMRSNPAGGDTDLEWIELHNGGDTDIDLAGWGVTWGTSSYKTPVELVGSIEAGGFFLIGGELVPDTDQVLSVSLGNASSSSDALRLECADGVADTVIYGEPNTDNWTNDLGDVATSLGSVPGDDQCLARKTDGWDTDETGEDFWVTSAAECTPGGMNADFTCEVAGADFIRLNEVVVNPEGTDTDAEWVEIHNGGSDTVRLDRWVIEGAKSSWIVQATLPTGAELPAGGYLVVGGPLAPVVDVEVSIDLGNAGSNGDGVRLVDCEGLVVDTVIYGENNDDLLEDDSGSIALTLAAVMGDGDSIARYPDGADTDLANEDWRLCSSPSPGEANAECASGGIVTVPPSGGSCGCGGRDVLPDSEDPTCVTVRGGATMGWLLVFGVVGFRRRRDC